jgi:hypothetical protein
MANSQDHRFGPRDAQRKRLVRQGGLDVDLALSNADAATAIGAFLRRLRRKGRNPDRWEAEQTVRAMAFLKRDQYRQAIECVGRALVPPSKRDPAAVREIEKASDGILPSLAALQRVLDEICDEVADWTPHESRPVDPPGEATADVVCIVCIDNVYH